MKRRVVVTGIGVISAIGTSADAFWRACLEGATAVQEIPAHWREYTDFRSTLMSPLPSIDYAERGITRTQRMQLDPVSLNAILAAGEAIGNAGWSMNGKSDSPLLDSGTAIYIGTAIGGVRTFLDSHLNPVSARPRKRLHEFAARGDLTAAQREVLDSISEQLPHPRRINPFMASMYMPNTVAASMGIQLSLTGRNRTYSQACASGTVAVGEAFRAIRAGEIDTALAGGSEYFDDYHGYLFQAFDVAGTLVQDCGDPEAANRPFDRRRSGFLWSQGASAILVLESYEQAVERRAPILAEVAGYAESFDAHSMMAMEPGGIQIEHMIRSCVRDAGLAVDEIGYINTHGTGTVSNDEVEADVLQRVFSNRPMINATKSLVGHTIGASGALEAAVLALSLHHQTTHPSRNLDDPIADLNFVTSTGHYALDCGLSQSFAFGGHNAAIAMKRAEDST